MVVQHFSFPLNVTSAIAPGLQLSLARHRSPVTSYSHHYMISLTPLTSPPPWLHLSHPALGRATPGILVPGMHCFCVAQVELPSGASPKCRAPLPMTACPHPRPACPEFDVPVDLLKKLPAARYSRDKTPAAHLSTAGCHLRTRCPSTRTSRRYCNTSGATSSYPLMPASGLLSLAPRPTTQATMLPSAREILAWMSGPDLLSV